MVAEKSSRSFPLTHPQKRIWYIEQLMPGTALHHICGIAELKGKIDIQVFEETIIRFIEKHEAFRIHFFEENQEAYQTISDFALTKIDLKDFSLEDNPQLSCDKWMKQEIEKPFHLINHDLFYMAIYKISDSRIGLFIKIHHLIFDGWSIHILAKQLCEMYEQRMASESVESPFICSYREFIDKEQQYLNSERFLKDENFWKSKFESLPELIFNESSDEISGKRKSFFIDEKLSIEMKRWTERHQCSLNEWFIMLLQIYIRKMLGKQDIVIGTPVYNRSGKREKQTIGMFTSTVPLRCEMDEHVSVKEYVKQVKKEIRKSYKHQKYPYDLLVKEMQLKKHGYNHLFQCCVNYYNFKPSNQLLDAEEVYNGYQLYPLQLVIKDWSDQSSLQLDFDFKTSVFTDLQIEQMYAKILQLADQILNNTNITIENLQLITETETQRLIYDFNHNETHYPKDKTIVQLFENQVEATPDRTAVTCENEVLTYGQLNKKANQLARSLQRDGIGRGQVVGVYASHSTELIVSILATLKTGAAYLPIDVCATPTRIEEILVDSEASCILTDRDIPQDLGFTGMIVGIKDQQLYLQDASNLNTIIHPDDLVYMIYTSGSTGKPKGVMIEHCSLVNYAYWSQKTYVNHMDEIFALYSSLAFDLTVTSIFTPLIGGNQIRVYQENDENFVLYDILADNKVTIIKLTPAHLSLLQDKSFPHSSVKRLIVGGEALKASLAQKIHQNFAQEIEIFNEYGPTETTVGCMVHLFDQTVSNQISVPIGTPADNVQIYILDEKLKPVPLGCIGELYISGDGVAKGYWNRPDLTRKYFIDNPFISGRKMYKTGDLARFLDGEMIEYVGRKDSQIKLRGYRIELGEIEYQLLQLPNIKEAVVVDCEMNSHRHLCAYIVKESSTNQMTAFKLKQELSKSLPVYMVPAHFIFMDNIPLTSNGKVNRSQLPLEFTSEENMTEDQVLTEIEKKVIAILQEILKVNSISIMDDFYKLGGDSIKAIQLASKLKSMGLNIRVKDILTYSVIKEIVACIEEDQDDRTINQEMIEGQIALSPIVSWFFSQEFKQSHHWNQSVLLNLSDEFEIDRFERIMNDLIKHHDSLRINLNEKTGMLFYNSHHVSQKFDVKRVDLSSISYERQQMELERLGFELKSTMNLENDLLLRACYFDLGKQGKRLLITAHHLIIDAVSWRILLQDMIKLLEDRNLSGTLPKKTHSYQYWVNQVETYASRLTDQDAVYWKSMKASKTWLPSDSVLNDQSQSIQQHSERLHSEETQALLTKANEAFKTEPVDLLIAALAITVKEFTNQNRVCIEMEGHGREEFENGLDLSRSVGWFTSMFPMQIEIGEEMISTKIKSVKEQMRKVPNKGFDYLILKYLSRDLLDDNGSMIRFNYLGDFDATVYPKLFTLSDESSGADIGSLNHLTAAMDITAMVINHELRLSISFNHNVFSPNTIQSFMEKWLYHLRTIIDYCSNQDHIEFTPSDFETLNLSQDELDSLIF
ncbi:amino acid adenylation domain-containing protein [Hazenella sp. IB182357]|uniref:Amino acid adenylation domain-containing protein n=1 Tax=Polycladospora coralii TaxID=2771432 RepID=A0A926NBG5_9BACL|nr:non-ribosomal peptide synthetase [Polycladospora coralii]MBD1372685.1 amino acid adenylation domain-containing protein [Polycladospora coralii]MBS7531079.1 amino acid adenylation domain-containing protein [Polycladospora coralii]